MISMEKLKAKLKTVSQSAKAKVASVLAAAGVGSVATVEPAAANYTFTGELSDVGLILADAVDLMPDILALALAVVPILIAFAIVGFVTGMFDGIISQISFRRR